ncbi:hypothetical protein BH23PLA1_BH23PLA1_28310 [soil metagenome]
METTPGFVAQTPEGGWRVAETRVSLDSVVHAFWEGLSPEAIVDAFPSLRLEQVHGAIATYRHNREEFDHYLADQEVRWEELRKRSHVESEPILQRLRGLRSVLRQKGPSD